MPQTLTKAASRGRQTTKSFAKVLVNRTAYKKENCISAISAFTTNVIMKDLYQQIACLYHTIANVSSMG